MAPTRSASKPRVVPWLLGALVVTAVATALHVGRSDPAYLRTGDW